MQVINERVTAIFMVISTKVRTPIMTHKAKAPDKTRDRAKEEGGKDFGFKIQMSDRHIPYQTAVTLKFTSTSTTSIR